MTNIITLRKIKTWWRYVWAAMKGNPLYPGSVTNTGGDGKYGSG